MEYIYVICINNLKISPCDLLMDIVLIDYFGDNWNDWFPVTLFLHFYYVTFKFSDKTLCS